MIVNKDDQWKSSNVTYVEKNFLHIHRFKIMKLITMGEEQVS